MMTTPDRAVSGCSGMLFRAVPAFGNSLFRNSSGTARQFRNSAENRRFCCSGVAVPKFIFSQFRNSAENLLFRCSPYGVENCSEQPSTLGGLGASKTAPQGCEWQTLTEAQITRAGSRS